MPILAVGATYSQIKTREDWHISCRVFEPQIPKLYLDASFGILKFRGNLALLLLCHSEAEDPIRCLCGLRNIC